MCVARRNFLSLAPHANFNHHEGVVRLATRCTASQVLIAIKQGVLDLFAHKEDVHLWFNDCDQDVCLAIWLMQHAERVSGVKSEPLISRLAYIVDMMDTCGGAFPIDPASRIMEEMCWIFEPYTSARTEGRIATFYVSETLTTIEAVCARISAYAMADGKRLKPDFRFEVIRDGLGWKMVWELGNDARTALRVAGVKAFVSIRSYHEEMKVCHANIGRFTPYTDFPLDQIYARLNEAEGISDGCMERWGGSDTIGGSPRSKGSNLSPEEIGNTISTFMRTRTDRQD